jgi:hypothetical protein
MIAHLEIALIELEYAAGDFYQREIAAVAQLEAGEQQKLTTKLQAATQALQVALTILGEPILDEAATYAA